MSMAAAGKPLTGRHVLAMLLAFFGVIIGVNFTMAWFANSTWSGLVVANGYVASQSFDKDVAKVRAQEALGWKVGFSVSGDRIRLTFADAQDAKIGTLAIAGKLERPVTDKQDQTLAFTPVGPGIYSAPAVLSPGVWEAEIEATGNGVSSYRKSFRFVVKGDTP